MASEKRLISEHLLNNDKHFTFWDTALYLFHAVRLHSLLQSLVIIIRSPPIDDVTKLLYFTANTQIKHCFVSYLEQLNSHIDSHIILFNYMSFQIK